MFRLSPKMKLLTLISILVWLLVFIVSFTKDYIRYQREETQHKSKIEYTPDMLTLKYYEQNYNDINFQIIVNGNISSNNAPVSVSEDISPHYESVQQNMYHNNTDTSRYLQEGLIPVPEATRVRFRDAYSGLSHIFSMYGITDWDFTRACASTSEFAVFYAYSNAGNATAQIIFRYDQQGKVPAVSISITEFKV